MPSKLVLQKKCEPSPIGVFLSLILRITLGLVFFSFLFSESFYTSFCRFCKGVLGVVEVFGSVTS